MATKEPKAPKVELNAEEVASLEHMETLEQEIAETMPEREAQGIEEQSKVEDLRSTIQEAKKMDEGSEERRTLARQRRPADE